MEILPVFLCLGPKNGPFAAASPWIVQIRKGGLRLV
jgi:hypothetical protein